MAEALPSSCPCVDIFHLVVRDSVEQRVRQECLMNRVDLVELGGQVSNPKDPYTAVTRRGGRTRHVRQNRLATVSEVASKTGRVLKTHHSGGDRAEQEIAISSGVCCRLGSGSASSWSKTVSDVSVELERVDHLANSVSAYRGSFPVCS